MLVSSSEYGWAGHTDNSGVQGSVKEVVEQILLHTVDQVMRGIYVLSRANEWVNVGLDSVKVWRLNFPYNCYSLDITNNRDVKEKGVMVLFLQFNTLEKYSLQVFLEGQSLASHRMIMAHRFQSSGDAITLDDLGEQNLV